MSKKHKHKAKQSTKPVVAVLGSATAQVERAGGRAVRVNAWDADAVLRAAQNADAILLCGGGDVEPKQYGEKAHAAVYGVSRDRDFAELLALEVAAERGIPVMGICRGAQIMNVHAGGTLEQHVPDRVGHGNHSHSDHTIETRRGSLVARAFRGSEREPVVSLHHQAVRALGEGFHPVAWAKDGTVEAIESDDGRCLGVQFHPEMSHRPAARRLFELFVERAREFAGIPSAVPAAWREREPAQRRKQLVMPRRADMPRAGAVESRWRCFRCDVDFDHRADYVDHMQVLHRVDLSVVG